jgi:hypothetical protein
MYFALLDIYGNVIQSDSESRVTILASSKSVIFETVLNGESTFYAEGGIFNVTGLMFTGDPDSVQ